MFKKKMNVHYSGGGCRVNIICDLGGAQSRVPRVLDILYTSSGLTDQLPGNGNICCGASY